MRASLIFHRVAMAEDYEPPRIRKLLSELKAEESLNASLREQKRESDERLVSINKAIQEERDRG